MEVKTVTIRNRAFQCTLCLAPELGELSLTNWRKLLRLAMVANAPWAEWYEENGSALREIRLYLPPIVEKANEDAETAKALYKKLRKPVTGDPIEKSRIKDHNDHLKWAAQAAAARYRKLSRMLEAFVEETQYYV